MPGAPLALSPLGKSAGRRILEGTRPQYIGEALCGLNMLVTDEDFVPLAGFPLLWRWTQETHLKLDVDQLSSIRPIRSVKAATVYERIVSVQLAPVRSEDRVVTRDETEPLIVGKWLEEKIPQDEREVLLLWDQETAALVPRRLFIDHWDEFWYPSSDDLTVTGAAVTWRVELHHHGVFEFSPVAPSNRS